MDREKALCWENRRQLEVRDLAAMAYGSPIQAKVAYTVVYEGPQNNSPLIWPAIGRHTYPPSLELVPAT